MFQNCFDDVWMCLEIGWTVVVETRACGGPVVCSAVRYYIHVVFNIVSITSMTSPAINKSPDKQKAESKSPSHSEQNGSPAEPPAPAPEPQQPDPFSWLRIFKLADLMMKQGC